MLQPWVFSRKHGEDQTPAGYKCKLDSRQGDGLGQRGEDGLGGHVGEDGRHVPHAAKQLCRLAPEIARPYSATYNELGGQRRLERICKFMRILADATLARPNRLQCLTQALLSSVSC